MTCEITSCGLAARAEMGAEHGDVTCVVEISVSMGWIRNMFGTCDSTNYACDNLDCCVGGPYRVSLERSVWSVLVDLKSSVWSRVGVVLKGNWYVTCRAEMGITHLLPCVVVAVPGSFVGLVINTGYAVGDLDYAVHGHYRVSTVDDGMLLEVDMPVLLYVRRYGTFALA